MAEPATGPIPFVAAALACAAASTALRADPPGFADVPRVTVSDPAFFRALLQSSADGVLRVAMIGDSQETSPWGWGQVYVPFINARLAATFGPCSETGPLTNIYAVESPQWLASMRRAVCGTPTTALAPNEVLPCIDVFRIPAGCGLGGIPYRAVFLPDAAAAVHPELVGGPWFAGASSCVAEALVYRTAGMSGVLWENQPIDGTAPTHEGATVQGGELVPSASGSPGTYEWLATPVLDYAGRRHVQVAMSATAWGDGVDLVAVRFRSTVADRGIVVHSFAKGGMRMADLVPQHGASGPMLRAWGPRAALIHLGANDAMEIADVEAWRARLLQGIAWIRSAMGDPAFPVIVASDLRVGTPGLPMQMTDRMPVVAHEIALQDPRVLAINLPRIVAEEYRWIPNQWYLHDTAHYRLYAQRMLAEALVGELCASLAVPYPRCPGVPWADCVRSLGVLCQPGPCTIMTDLDAADRSFRWGGPGSTCADADADGWIDACAPLVPEDFNGDGMVGGSDLSFLLASWGPGSGPADLTRDGRVDGADLARLLSRWGPVVP